MHEVFSHSFAEFISNCIETHLTVILSLLERRVIGGRYILIIDFKGIVHLLFIL